MKKLLFIFLLSVGFSTHADCFRGLQESGKFFDVEIFKVEAAALLHFIALESGMIKEIYNQFEADVTDNSKSKDNASKTVKNSENSLSMAAFNAALTSGGIVINNNRVEVGSGLSLGVSIESDKEDARKVLKRAVQDDRDRISTPVVVNDIESQSKQNEKKPGNQYVTAENVSDENSVFNLSRNLESSTMSRPTSTLNNSNSSELGSLTQVVSVTSTLVAPQQEQDAGNNIIPISGASTPTDSAISNKSLAASLMEQSPLRKISEELKLVNALNKAIDTTLRMHASQLSDAQKAIILKNTLVSSAQKANAGSDKVQSSTLFDHLLLNHIGTMKQSKPGESINQDITQLKTDISEWKNRKENLRNTWKAEHEVRAQTLANLLNAFENLFNTGELDLASKQLDLIQKEIDAEKSSSMNTVEYKQKIDALKSKLTALNSKKINNALHGRENYIAQADLGLITMALRRVSDLQSINYENLYKQAQLLVLSSLMEAAWLNDKYINDVDLVQDNLKTWLVAIRNMKNNQYISNQDLATLPAIENLANELAAYADAVKQDIAQTAVAA